MGLFAILDPQNALYGVLAGLCSVLWVGVGSWLINRAIKKDGSLKIAVQNETFLLNKKLYSFSELNFYKSNLIAPRIGLATGFSSQHLTFGVPNNVFKIADDVAAVRFSEEHISALKALFKKSSLKEDDLNSFNTLLERVQVLRN